MASLTFWFEFASTYSYLSAMQIEDLGRKTDVKVIWKPFLLGPIFKAQNWDSSPFNLYPAKGRYMAHDIERIAKERGLVFRLPDPFPQNGLMAARLALAGLADHAFERAQSPEIKARLRANTEEALALSIFGAPSFTTAAGELFWSDDRLEQALLWSRGKRDAFSCRSIKKMLYRLLRF